MHDGIYDFLVQHHAPNWLVAIVGLGFGGSVLMPFLNKIRELLRARRDAIDATARAKREQADAVNMGDALSVAKASLAISQKLQADAEVIKADAALTKAEASVIKATAVITEKRLSETEQRLSECELRHSDCEAKQTLSDEKLAAVQDEVATLRASMGQQPIPDQTVVTVTTVKS